MVKAVFAGTFDPPTNGHLNIIQRASRIFDSIDVVIAVNSTKKCLFTAEERLLMFQELIKPYKNVSVHTYSGLIVDYAKQNDARVLIRGIRNTVDFAYEFDLCVMNKNLNPDADTVFIPTEQRYAIVRSSSIKELASFGGDISGMVPPIVEDAMLRRLKEQKEQSDKK